MTNSPFQFIDIECYSNYFLLIAIGSGSENSAKISKYIEADIRHDQVAKKEILATMEYTKFEVIYNSHSKRLTIDHIQVFKDLVEFTRGKTLIAHNGDKYDFVLLDLIAWNLHKYSTMATRDVLKDIHDLSDMIVHNNDIWIYQLHPDLQQSKFAKWKHNFYGIDTLKSLYETVHRKSAKQTAIMLKWHRIQDLPIEPETIIRDSDKFDMVDYCINDTLIVWKFFYHKIDVILLKFKVIKKFNITGALNMNKSSLADAYLIKRYEEESGESYWNFKNIQTIRYNIKLKPLIWEGIKFQTKPFIDLFNIILNTTIDTTATKKFEKVFIYNETKYVIATGGLHSGDQPAIFDSTNEYLLRDVDGDSFYPRTILMRGISPKHLNKIAFIRIFTEPVTSRLQAKRDVKKYKELAKNETNEIKKKEYLQLMDDAQTFADFFKIVINAGGFGKMNYDGWMKDAAALYEVTMNCQLMLLMLVEMLELKGFHCISANTDGIIAKVDRKREDEYYAVCNEWCKVTGHTVEYTDYDRYVRLNVNSYLAVKTSYKISHNDHDIKTKNAFITEVDIDKGYNMPIIAKALFAYYIHDTPVREFIETYKGDSDDPFIYDFCLSQKVGDTFYLETLSLIDNQLHKEHLQKNVRYYVSKTGVVLTKVYKEPTYNKAGQLQKPKRIIAGKYVTIFNNYELGITDYNIDYDFYVSEIMKKINDVDNLITKKMKTRSGKMFDDDN